MTTIPNTDSKLLTAERVAETFGFNHTEKAIRAYRIQREYETQSQERLHNPLAAET